MIYRNEDLSAKTNSNRTSNERANAGHVDGYVKLALKPFINEIEANETGADFIPQGPVVQKRVKS